MLGTAWLEGWRKIIVFAFITVTTFIAGMFGVLNEQMVAVLTIGMKFFFGANTIEWGAKAIAAATSAKALVKEIKDDLAAPVESQPP